MRENWAAILPDLDHLEEFVCVELDAVWRVI